MTSVTAIPLTPVDENEEFCDNFYDPSANKKRVVPLWRYGYKRLREKDQETRRGCLLHALRQAPELSQDVDRLCSILDWAKISSRAMWPTESQAISDDWEWFYKHRKLIKEYISTTEPPESSRAQARREAKEAKQREQREMLASGVKKEGYTWESWTV
jgi:hypothetical protein